MNLFQFARAKPFDKANAKFFFHVIQNNVPLTVLIQLA